jgi:hypothetical protein
LVDVEDTIIEVHSYVTQGRRATDTLSARPAIDPAEALKSNRTRQISAAG